MQNESGFTPNGDLVLILPPPVEEKTAGGIVLPKTTQQAQGKATRIGQVIDMGDDAAMDSRMTGINIGDMVLFPRYVGDELPVNGVTYLIMRANSILGPITKLPDYQIGAAKSSMEAFGANVAQVS
jgi:chaperonin GroES